MPANNQDRIDSYIDLPAVNKETEAMKKQLSDILSLYQKINNTKISLEGSKSFTDVSKGARTLKTDVDELEKAQKNLTKALSEQNVELQGYKAQIAEANKAAKEQAKEQLGLTNEYERSTKRLIELKRQLKDLAVQGKESTDEFKALNTEFQALDGTIRKAEEGVGEFGRNVGNYTNSFKGALGVLETELTNVADKLNSGNFKGDEFNDLAKQQLVLKEATALVNKEFTSATAQSNAYKEAATKVGLAFGTDSKVFKNFSAEVGKGSKELGNVSKALKEAEGNGTKANGAFTKIFSAFRNIANIIPGIGLSGLFLLIATPVAAAAKSLLDFAKNTATGAKAIEDFKAKQELLNKTLAQTGNEYSNAVKLVDELKININLAKEGFLDKDKVLHEYNDTIGKTTGQVKTLDEAEQQLTKNGPAYIQMMLLKAAANIALQEAAKKAFEVEQTRQKSLTEFSKLQDGFQDAESARFETAADIARRQKFIDAERTKRKEEEIKVSKKAEDDNLKIAEDFQKKAAEIAKNFKFDFFGGTEDAKTTKKKDDAEKKAEERAKTLFQALIDLQKAYDDGIIDDLKRVGDSESNIYGLRITALKLFLKAKTDEINKAADNEIAVNHLSGAAELAVRQNAANDIKALESTVAKEIGDIRIKRDKEANDEIIKQHEAFEEKMFLLADISLEHVKSNHEAEIKAEKDAAAKKLEIRKQLYEKEQELAQALVDLGLTIITAKNEREINDLQEQIDLLDQKRQKDIDVANQTIVNEQDKAAAIATINAKADADKRVLEQRQRQEKLKEARAERDAQALSIFGSAVAAHFKIISQLGYPAGLFVALANDALAAVQIAALYAKPLPRYKTGKGKGDKYEGLSIVGDGGVPEVIGRSDGSFELTPAKDTLAFVGKDDTVYPSVEAFEKDMLNKSLRVPISNMPQKRDNSELLVKALTREFTMLRRDIKNKRENHYHVTPYGLQASQQSMNDQIKYFNEQTNWSS